MSLPGNDDVEKLDALCQKTHKEQAIWFINAYWNSFGEAEAENIWNYKHKFDELDLVNGKAGCSLDELNAHRFLESFNQTMTVKEMRDKLRAKNALKPGIAKMVPLSHFLAIKYDVDFHILVNATQGDNQEEIQKAQAMLDSAKKALDAAVAAASEARKRENEARSAQNELEAALAELKAQEDAYNNRTEALKKASETGGVVARSRAKNELAQHLETDPLPLRRAKLNQEAAVRKAERATQAAVAAREEAERKRQAAEQSVAEAQAYLDEVKAKSGSGQGSIWWIERELHEAKKFMPLSKGGIQK